MSVSDFMTKNLVIVAPDTPIFDAIDLMKQHDIHRLPVLQQDKLVGLITEGIIQEAMPSKATSLSVYEANYLLNKTTVGDVMEKNVLTIAPDALLEDAIYKMRENKIAVLPVVEKEAVKGIITNNDIFAAFLKITGYNDGGTRISLQIADDHVGILAEITKLLAEHDFSILTIVVNRMELATIVEIQVQSRNVEKVKEVLTEAGYLVTAAVLTNTHNM
ncbi:CBS and ACT domain-containing protein [Enterococcus montenegrensis]|uniref:CBS and ACT domain-containing protein n=1 Tax=Enterococcus montenegrensis TaxID=3031993 RepID=UPI00249F4C4A|nr:CBS and ACT domain-containing protein [Enterococcus montenegrensis]WHA10081.1 CBS and ACT domain-containing protein [Enterococcus montenegrensis]